MSREFGIHPKDLATMKPWHLEAMLLHLEEMRRG
jgi:uncharacterized protein YbaP (TraB family)